MSAAHYRLQNEQSECFAAWSMIQCINLNNRRK